MGWVICTIIGLPLFFCWYTYDRSFVSNDDWRGWIGDWVVFTSGAKSPSQWRGTPTASSRMKYADCCGHLVPGAGFRKLCPLATTWIFRPALWTSFWTSVCHMLCIKAVSKRISQGVVTLVLRQRFQQFYSNLFYSSQAVWGYQSSGHKNPFWICLSNFSLHNMVFVLLW